MQERFAEGCPLHSFQQHRRCRGRPPWCTTGWTSAAPAPCYACSRISVRKMQTCSSGVSNLIYNYTQVSAASSWWCGPGCPSWGRCTRRTRRPWRSSCAGTPCPGGTSGGIYLFLSLFLFWHLLYFCTRISKCQIYSVKYIIRVYLEWYSPGTCTTWTGPSMAVTSCTSIW